VPVQIKFRLRYKHRIFRYDLRRNDAQLGEGVSDGLLFGKNHRIDGFIYVRVVPQARLDHARIQTLNGHELRRCIGIMGAHPLTFRAHFFQNGREHVAIPLSEWPRPVPATIHVIRAARGRPNQQQAKQDTPCT